MLVMNANGQVNANSCSSPEASQFDFWLGNWDLTWNDTSKGTNHVEKILGSCVVQENFIDPVGNLFGKSWSMYNPAKKLWQQTWVDNQGGYIVLTGKYDGKKMTLSTMPVKAPDGKVDISRMIFYNITKNSFDWNWEKSTNGGKTWTLVWKINYKRARE
jgi:hypothetical protein